MLFIFPQYATIALSSGTTCMAISASHNIISSESSVRNSVYPTVDTGSGDQQNLKRPEKCNMWRLKYLILFLLWHDPLLPHWFFICCCFIAFIVSRHKQGCKKPPESQDVNEILYYGHVYCRSGLEKKKS